ncbi:transglutaminase-like domain-containing protein [Methanococcus maripaludis]|nr:transglutaminase-like domain-containing protein [Methanococcus maripaludis]
MDDVDIVTGRTAELITEDDNRMLISGSKRFESVMNTFMDHKPVTIRNQTQKDDFIKAVFNTKLDNIVARILFSKSENGEVGEFSTTRMCNWFRSNYTWKKRDDHTVVDPITFFKERTGVCADATMFMLKTIPNNYRYLLQRTPRGGKAGHVAAGIRFDKNILVLDQTSKYMLRDRIGDFDVMYGMNMQDRTVAMLNLHTNEIIKTVQM